MNKHCQSYMYAQVHDQIIKYIKTTSTTALLYRLVYLRILPYDYIYNKWLLR